MRPSRANAGNTIARRWRPWLWATDQEPNADRTPTPPTPTPVRDEVKVVDQREPDPNH